MRKNLKVIHLDHDGYLKWYQDWYQTDDVKRAERSWNSKVLTNVDGILYAWFIEHRDFNSKEQCDIARKYGFETIEEIEWTTI